MPKSDIPLPKSQYERERERWPEVARMAVMMLGRPAEDRRLSLAMLLQEHFSDIPDKAPPSDDVQAYAAFAMKMLLLTLIDKREGRLEQLGEKAHHRMAKVFGIPPEYLFRKLTDPELLELRPALKRAFGGLDLDELLDDLKSFRPARKFKA